MSVYNDNLEFDDAGLKVQIGVLEEVRDVIKKLKEEFISYNESHLKAHWTTAGATELQTKLESYINNDIESFIKYIDGRIIDLNSALGDTEKIDQA